MQPDGRRIFDIYNPVAGSRRHGRLGTYCEALAQQGCRIVVRETRARGDAEAFARATDCNVFDAVVVAGGDGIVNEAVNGLAGGVIPLGVIPLGTANVLAAEIGLLDGPLQSARVIAHGTPRRIGTGVANGRRFIMMSGVGFDAHVVANTSPALKRRFGKLAYVWQTMRKFRSFAFSRYRFCIDGVAHDAASAVIANGHFYAGRFVCAPAARLDDGMLHVCLFQTPGAAAAMRYTAAMMLGRLGALSDVNVIPARVIDVEGPADDPVQGDGDTVAHLPVRIASDSASLSVFAGEHAFLSRNAVAEASAAERL